MAAFKRSQGRKFDELRPISITKNYLKFAHGSALIECGNNKVICSATIEEKVPPFLEGKNKGWITAEYGMLPAATHQRTQRERTKVGGRTYEIQRLIGRALRAITHLDLLGERTIFIDCDVIQADGGTRCASITGAYIALHEALKQIDSHAHFFKDSIAAVSVGIVQDELLLDLEYNEDSKARVDMNFVVTGNNEFVEIQGTGEEATFTQKEMTEMTKLALQGIEKITALQRKT